MGSVHWEQPSDWITCNLFTLYGGAAPNVTGYWIRAFVLAVGGAPVAPVQRQARNWYSINWSFTEVQEATVKGDIPALARIQLRTQSNRAVATAPTLYTQRYVMGLRSYSRGERFRAFLNVSDEQNPSNVSTVPGGALVFANDVEAPTGRSLSWTPGPGTVDVCGFLISYISADAWAGRYRMFLRLQQSGGAAGDATFSGRLQSGHALVYNTIFDSEWVPTYNTTDHQILDLGAIEIPGRYPVGPNMRNQFILWIRGNCINAGATWTLYDLVLIPTDEWAVDVRLSNYAMSSRYDVPVQIDSLTYPDQFLTTRCYVEGATYNTFYSWWTSIKNNHAMLHPNSQQRLWTLAMRETSGGVLTCEHEIAHTITVTRADRYLIPRGDQ